MASLLLVARVLIICDAFYLLYFFFVLELISAEIVKARKIKWNMSWFQKNCMEHVLISEKLHGLFKS